MCGILIGRELRIRYGYQALLIEGCAFSPISLLFMPVNSHNIYQIKADYLSNSMLLIASLYIAN